MKLHQVVGTRGGRLGSNVVVGKRDGHVPISGLGGQVWLLGQMTMLWLVC